MAKIKVELTLQEKLRDLREEKKMTLSDLADATGIPLSTLQRTEGQDDVRVGYQDITELARFYNVSTDYLFGVTDNLQHRNIDVDKLRLSDSAVEVLKSADINNRLLSEVISHPDFPKLMSAIEIYVDRKVLPQMNTMNAMYKIAEKTIMDKAAIADKDEMITLLGEAIVDEDEYLRYRITERFSEMMKSIYDAHRKDASPDEETNVVKNMKAALEDYKVDEADEEKARIKFHILTRELGLNTKELTQEEIAVLMKALQKSNKFKSIRRQGKRRK